MLGANAKVRDEIEKELLLQTVNIYTKSQMSEQIKTILPAIVGFTISGLWLFYQLGVLKYLKKINDQKRILWPSLFFLTSPFIFSLAFSGAGGIASLSEIPGINSVITILTTTASIYIGNWFLDSYRKEQKKKEIAKMLVSSLEEHLTYFKHIKTNLEKMYFGGIILPSNGIRLREELNTININIAFIENDDLYNTALNQIVILPTERLKEITRYSNLLKQLIYEFKKIEDKKLEVIISGRFHLLKSKIECIDISAGLCLIGLSKEVLNDVKLFNKFKDLVKINYFRIKLNYDKNNQSTLFGLPNSVEKTIEAAFEEFGIGDELNN